LRTTLNKPLKGPGRSSIHERLDHRWSGFFYAAQ
jgi:hypothetical protein